MKPSKMIFGLSLLAYAFAANVALAKTTAVCEDKFQKDIKISRVAKEKVRVVWPKTNIRRAHAITYEKMSARVANDIGFKTAAGTTVYMQAGDDDVPNEYVVLPDNWETADKFDAASASNATDESFDPDSTIKMSCLASK